MGSPSQVPGEEVVLDEHVPYSFTQWLGRLSLGRQLPVGVEVEGELRQQSEFALNLDPARAVDERPRMVPLGHH